MKSWLRKVDERGEGVLVRTSEPVNRFPDYVRYLVRQLKALCPTMGKVRIAQVLARAGLHLGPTTVGRILREKGPLPVDISCQIAIQARRVTVRKPGDLWHLDLTAVPTGAGFWVPWLPFALPQRWPFCWWVLVVLDHASRAVMATAVFRRPPSSLQLQLRVSDAIDQAGRPPRHVLTDKGLQFWCGSWRRYCRERGMRPRYGAIGRRGGIAIVECTSQLLVSLADASMRHELRLYTTWYNAHRPNQALGGRTPKEVYRELLPANAAWPLATRCGSGCEHRLVVGYLAGRRHLPIVELREVA